MQRKFPSTVKLDPDEIWRANRIRIAQFYSIAPAQVDAMPASDVDDTLEVLWANEQNK